MPGISNDIADPQGREIAHDRVPTKAAALLTFIKRAQRALPQITAPMLIMHGRNDHTVHPSNANYIHDHVSSDDKELVWLERSYHVVTDYDKDHVFERTLGFIKERASHAI